MPRKKPNPWQGTIDAMTAFASRHALSIELREPGHPQYQIAVLRSDGVRLVVYPHRTRGTGSVMARIRDENSRDKAAAERLMALTGYWIKNKGAWTARSMGLTDAE